METISYTLPPDQDGATVRHILKAVLHVSSHAISRLTRMENGIRVNGRHARTVDLLHTGDVLEVETGDHRPPRVHPGSGLRLERAAAGRNRRDYPHERG